MLLMSPVEFCCCKINCVSTHKVIMCIRRLDSEVYLAKGSKPRGWTINEYLKNKVLAHLHIQVVGMVFWF